jgi:hypothetical protein
MASSIAAVSLVACAGCTQAIATEVSTTISSQQSAVSYQLSAISYQLSAVSFRPWPSRERRSDALPIEQIETTGSRPATALRVPAAGRRGSAQSETAHESARVQLAGATVHERQQDLPDEQGFGSVLAGVKGTLHATNGASEFQL